MLHDESMVNSFMADADRWLEKKELGDPAFCMAVSFYTSAINNDPTCFQAYMKRGAAYSQLKKFNKAISDFSRALELKPNDEEAYCCRGITYYNKGSIAEAMLDIYHTLLLNPRNRLATICLKQILQNYKEKFYIVIKLLSDEEAILLLEQALNKKTFVGRRFCSVISCESPLSVEEGLLKEIKDYHLYLTDKIAIKKAVKLICSLRAERNSYLSHPPNNVCALIAATAASTTTVTLPLDEVEKIVVTTTNEIDEENIRRSATSLSK